MTRPSRRGVLGTALAAMAAALAGCASPPGDRTVAGARRQTYRYGPAAAQVAELHLPSGAVRGVVVLVHGGYWQAGYDRSLEGAVAADLVGDGWAVWNIDYRGVGDGGGWPSTFADVAAATDLLAIAAEQHDLPTDQVLAVGHSAGGTLALWLAARRHLPPLSVGSSPEVQVSGVVSQAGVNDLTTGSRDRLGGGAVDSVMGGPPAGMPERYAIVDPTRLLPLGVPLLVVAGSQDDVVPVSQSRAFAAAARAAGDDVRLDVVDGEGHFEHLDPTSEAWSSVRDWLAAR